MHILSQDAANIETKQRRQYSSFNIYVFSATQRTKISNQKLLHRSRYIQKRKV